MINGESIENLNKTDTVVILGAGNVGKEVFNYCRANKIHINAISDNDSSKWGKVFKGKKIVSPQVCFERFKNATFLIANEKYWKEIMQQVTDAGIESVIVCNEYNRIHELYVSSVKNYSYNDIYRYDRPIIKGMDYYLKKFVYVCNSVANNVSLHFTTNNRTQKKYEVSLCLIFKNEANYLREWIEFHRIIGIDHFYLYNNNSNDHYMDVLKEYIDLKIVELLDWPIDHSQLTAYKDCISRFSNETNWLGFIDADEFVVPVAYKSIKQFLRTKRKYGSVLLNWKCFGYNGLFDRNRNGLCIEDFTQCDEKYTYTGKCFYNTEFEMVDGEKNRLFHHYLYTKKNGKEYPPVNCFGLFCNDRYQFARSNIFPIQLNHYLHKSYMESIERRNKGDVFFEKSYRNDKLFFDNESFMDDVDKKIFVYMSELKARMGRE